MGIMCKAETLLFDFNNLFKRDFADDRDERVGNEEIDDIDGDLDVPV